MKLHLAYVFISLRPKNSLRNFVLKHPQTMSFARGERLRGSLKNKVYNLYISNVQFPSSYL